jgi:HAD superfamily hydrolase (TIGR01509 family)
MTLRGLIFDVDGTLADTEEVHRAAFNAAFAANGLSWCWGQRIYGELLKVTGGRERIAHFIDAMDISTAEKTRLLTLVAPIHADKTRIYVERIAAGRVELLPGVEALLREARRDGLKLAIATTTSRPNVDALLTRTLGKNALDWFSVIATGETGVAKKPDPGIYRYALEELWLAPREVIALEDSANGVTAAKSAGIFTVVIPTLWTANENLRVADLKLDRLSEAGSLRSLTTSHARSLSVGWEAA